MLLYQLDNTLYNIAPSFKEDHEGRSYEQGASSSTTLLSTARLQESEKQYFALNSEHSLLNRSQPEINQRYMMRGRSSENERQLLLQPRMQKKPDEQHTFLISSEVVNYKVQYNLLRLDMTKFNEIKLPHSKNLNARSIHEIEIQKFPLSLADKSKVISQCALLSKQLVLACVDESNQVGFLHVSDLVNTESALEKLGIGLPEMVVTNYQRQFQVKKLDQDFQLQRIIKVKGNFVTAILVFAAPNKPTLVFDTLVYSPSLKKLINLDRKYLQRQALTQLTMTSVSPSLLWQNRSFQTQVDGKKRNDHYVLQNLTNYNYYKGSTEQIASEFILYSKNNTGSFGAVLLSSNTGIQLFVRTCSQMRGESFFLSSMECGQNCNQTELIYNQQICLTEQFENSGQLKSQSINTETSLKFIKRVTMRYQTSLNLEQFIEQNKLKIALAMLMFIGIACVFSERFELISPSSSSGKKDNPSERTDYSNNVRANAANLIDGVSTQNSSNSPQVCGIKIIERTSPQQVEAMRRVKIDKIGFEPSSDFELNLDQIQNLKDEQNNMARYQQGLHLIQPFEQVPAKSKVEVHSQAQAGRRNVGFDEMEEEEEEKQQHDEQFKQTRDAEYLIEQSIDEFCAIQNMPSNQNKIQNQVFEIKSHNQINQNLDSSSVEVCNRMRLFNQNNNVISKNNHNACRVSAIQTKFGKLATTQSLYPVSKNESLMNQGVRHKSTNNQNEDLFSEFQDFNLQTQEESVLQMCEAESTKKGGCYYSRNNRSVNQENYTMGSRNENFQASVCQQEDISNQSNQLSAINFYRSPHNQESDKIQNREYQISEDFNQNEIQKQIYFQLDDKDFIVPQQELISTASNFRLINQKQQSTDLYYSCNTQPFNCKDENSFSSPRQELIRTLQLELSHSQKYKSRKDDYKLLPQINMTTLNYQQEGLHMDNPYFPQNLTLPPISLRTSNQENAQQYLPRQLLQQPELRISTNSQQSKCLGSNNIQGVRSDRTITNILAKRSAKQGDQFKFIRRLDSIGKGKNNFMKKLQSQHSLQIQLQGRERQGEFRQQQLNCFTQRCSLNQNDERILLNQSKFKSQNQQKAFSDHSPASDSDSHHHPLLLRYQIQKSNQSICGSCTKPEVNENYNQLNHPKNNQQSHHLQKNHSLYNRENNQNSLPTHDSTHYQNKPINFQSFKLDSTNENDFFQLFHNTVQSVAATAHCESSSSTKKSTLSQSSNLDQSSTSSSQTPNSMFPLSFQEQSANFEEEILNQMDLSSSTNSQTNSSILNSDFQCQRFYDNFHQQMGSNGNQEKFDPFFSLSDTHDKSFLSSSSNNEHGDTVKKIRHINNDFQQQEFFDIKDFQFISESLFEESQENKKQKDISNILLNHPANFSSLFDQCNQMEKLQKITQQINEDFLLSANNLLNNQSKKDI